MDNRAFIGVGAAVEGPELPMGLGMKLPFYPDALDTYSRMSEAERERLVRFIQAGSSGDDAKRRISEALHKLAEGETSAF